jgi:hypothetical protein
MPESVGTTTPSVYDLDANHAMACTKFRLPLVIVNECGHEQVHEVARIEREGLEMETRSHLGHRAQLAIEWELAMVAVRAQIPGTGKLRLTQ